MSVSLGLQAFHPFLPLDPVEIEQENYRNSKRSATVQRSSSSISFLLNPTDEENGLEVAGLFALAEMRNSSDFFHTSSSSISSHGSMSSPRRSSPTSFYFNSESRPGFASLQSDFYTKSDEFQPQKSEASKSFPFRSLPSSPTSNFSFYSASGVPLSPPQSSIAVVGTKRGRTESKNERSNEAKRYLAKQRLEKGETKEAKEDPPQPTGAPDEDPRQFWNFYQKGGSREVKDPILGKVVRSYLACSEKKRGCPAELVVSLTVDEVNHFRPQNNHNHLPPKRLRVKKCTKSH
eukprot:TRINITY_DN11232_c0_g1_i1.p1 TRINITY_DN11232_c0_g1~~TRINITY_DN11232_c0_g1_i1.p1  ORF type:complete len:291 (+),score=85.93 TRINITY_DN11232_c0_g1_i1:206-1078(+)